MMEPALGQPFGANDDDHQDIRDRTETLFRDFAQGADTVKVRDLPDMLVEYERVQGYPFFAPGKEQMMLNFAAENGELLVRSNQLVNLVIGMEMTRSPTHSPALEQRSDTESSSDEDAAPGTVFKGRASGSPSFSRPLPPRLRGRHSSAGERSSTRSPTTSDAAYVSSPLGNRSRQLSASSEIDESDAQLELVETQRRITQLEDELVERSQSLEVLKEQLRDEEGKMTGLEQELHERATTIEKLNEQLAEREQKLEKLHGLEDTYETRMVELQEHSEELASQLRVSAKENKELRTKSQSRQAYIERLEVEVSTLQKKRQEDESALSKLRRDHDGLKKDHNRLQKEREDQTDATERVRQQLLKETERVERKQQEVDRLAYQVQEKTKEAQRAERRIAELERQIEPLNEALAGTQSANADLQQMIEAMRDGDLTDNESLVGRHRRLSSEMGDAASRRGGSSSAGDGRSESSSAPPSEPDTDWQSDGDAQSIDDFGVDDETLSLPGSRTGSMRGNRAALASSVDSKSPSRVNFPRTPTLAAAFDRSNDVKGSAPAESPAKVAAEAASDVDGGEEAQNRVATSAEVETAATAVADPDKTDSDDLQTTPRMQAASKLDDIAPLDLDARLDPTGSVSTPVKQHQRPAVSASSPFRARLKLPAHSLLSKPAVDLPALLRRTEVYIALLAVLFGIVLGSLTSMPSSLLLCGPSDGLSKHEAYAFHAANTMSMPYAFAPDLGEEGLFSPVDPPQLWYTRMFGAAARAGSRSSGGDFFVPT